MRLLERDDVGEFRLIGSPEGDASLPYAILSHTWGADGDEVLFEDFNAGIEKTKPGYQKIRFCGEQANRDGLQHFWTDTCCINKMYASELQEAVNSMFRWYQNAAKCYVYLSDVSLPSGANAETDQHAWEPAFRESRWFTRGWTLQELLAPVSVEFFSKEGSRLGDKSSLEQLIVEITDIPARALRASILSGFSTTEIILWQTTRDTTRKEDRAYSLMGICGVSMLLNYGEGQQRAFKRLQREIVDSLQGSEYENFSLTSSVADVRGVQHFTAREAELESMYSALLGDGSRRTAILHGLGGIGKTQLAVKFTKRHKERYSAIIWLNASDEDFLQQSFATAARRIQREYPSFDQLANVDMKDLDAVAEAVKAWLCLPGNTRWLLIYDNYDNPKLPSSTDPAALDLHKYLPDSDQGAVIVTTRVSQVKLGSMISVKKLDDLHDSLEILRNTSGREDLTSDPCSSELAKELDGLPLALATAGAYLDQTTTTCNEYLQLYRNSWAELQKQTPDVSSYDRGLYSTWQISFKHVRERNKLSAQLLRLWAYLDNEDIWFELLQRGNPQDVEWLRELTKDQLSFTAAMRVLCNYGLVEANPNSQELIESRGYSMHGCVHQWTIGILNQVRSDEMVNLALLLVTSDIPDTNAQNWWVIQKGILKHAARCCSTIFHGSVTCNTLELVCHNLANLYVDQGKLDEADAMFQLSLQKYEKKSGPKDLGTLGALNNLGNLYLEQGKLDEAMTAYQRVLREYEDTIGPDHTTTLDVVTNLGNLYTELDRPEIAESMYRRALQGFETTLGSEHLATLDVVGNLAILYSGRDRPDEAEILFTRALRGYEKALGPEHTSTLDTASNLATHYEEQDRLEDAETMNLWALRGYEKIHGPEHSTTLITAQNLGDVYMSQGKLNGAEGLFIQALHGLGKTLGPNHKSTLEAARRMGALYTLHGRLDEAEAMYQRALQGFSKIRGPDHISTLFVMDALANLYTNQNKFELAESVYRQAILGHERVWGPNKDSVLGYTANLGRLYQKQGKLDEAELTFKRILERFELAHDRSSITEAEVTTLWSLGDLYRDRRQAVEAIACYSRASKGFQALSGPCDDSRYLDSWVATLKSTQGQPAFLRRIFERKSGLSKALRRLTRRDSEARANAG